jgi:hypothetical protein
MNHPLYPWVDSRNRRGTGHCRRRPGLPVCSALLLTGSLAMACSYPRWHASFLSRRICVFPLWFVFLCYGELRGEMREGSTQAVELGTCFFFYFFVFCFSFFFNLFLSRPSRIECGILQEIRNSMRESEERAGERERDRRGREKWQ